MIWEYGAGLIGVLVDMGGARKEAVGGGGNPPLGSVDVPGAPAAIRDVATPEGLYEVEVGGTPGAPE